MNRMLLTLCFCSYFFFSFGQYPTNMNGYTTSWGLCLLTDDFPLTGVSTEIPPWTIAGGWHMYFAHDGSRTVSYSVPTAMAPGTTVNCVGNGPFFAVGPDGNKAWKRNYCGIYSAHYFSHPSAGPINIGFCHDENTNLCSNLGNQSTAIQPNCTNQCYQCDAYHALVNAVWTPSNQGNNWGQQGFNNDLGPILWPGAGFLDPNNNSASQGLMQPSSIVVGNYVYIFIWDKGPYQPNVNPQEGRTRGIKLVRAAIGDCLDPTKYQVYYKDPSGNVNWLSSLPAGFTKETMMQYLHTQGPKSTDILSDQIPNNTECFRFSVAQVKNTNYFIAVEEYVDNNARAAGNPWHFVALRFSNDLMNWSSREMIVENAQTWDASNLNYPILLSADGWSNTAVDLNNFYVLGTHSQSPFKNGVTMVRVSYSPPTPPLPPPSRSPCGGACQPPCPEAVLAGGPARTGPAPSIANCPPPAATSSAAVSSIGEGSSLDGSASMIYPNPTRGVFQIDYSVPVSTVTKVEVFDAAGKLLLSGQPVSKLAGRYTQSLDLSHYGNGVYLLVLTVGGEKKTFKIIRN